MVFKFPIKWIFSDEDEEDEDLKKNKKEESYIEITPQEQITEAKIYIRVCKLQDFADVKEVIDLLREGNYILFIDGSILRNRDFSEFKRIVNKIKKTVEAIEGDIVLVQEYWIIATPSIAKIYRRRQQTQEEN